MARGFDDLYRVFIVRPLRSRASSCSRDSSRLTTPSPYSSRSRSRVRSLEEHSENLSSFYGCGFVIYLFIYVFIYLISKFISFVMFILTDFKHIAFLLVL